MSGMYGEKKGFIVLLLCLFLVLPALSYAGVKDVAVFAPGVDNWMSATRQNELAVHLSAEVNAQSIQTFSFSTQANLVIWMNANMADGESDVLVIADLAPQSVYGGEDDGSLAEQWIDNGNLLIWTGSQAFHSYVNSSGVISSAGAGDAGANEVLDVNGEGLTKGYASVNQKNTVVASDAPGHYNYLPSLNLNYSSADGSDMRSLKYGDLLIKSQSVAGWDAAPDMLVDEMFAENSDATDTTHVYESDAIVLTQRDIRGEAGQYAQFYCYRGLIDGSDVNEYRKPVLVEFLNNWVATPVNLIWVDPSSSAVESLLVEGEGQGDTYYSTACSKTGCAALEAVEGTYDASATQMDDVGGGNMVVDLDNTTGVLGDNNWVVIKALISSPNINNGNDPAVIKLGYQLNSGVSVFSERDFYIYAEGENNWKEVYWTVPVALTAAEVNRLEGLIQTVSFYDAETGPKGIFVDKMWIELRDGSENYPFDKIQSGIDAAGVYSRDRVIVKEGLYYEQLQMKSSVKMISDDSSVGNDRETDPANIPGHAEDFGEVSKKPLKRAIRTVIDGTGGPSGIDGVPMADFPRGATVGTWLDGFNIQNMPQVNHEIPGHAHVIQTRGASATIIDNMVHNNGSSGLGSHAWFNDQEMECPGYSSNTPCRDFSYSNVQYDAHPVLVNNIVYRNEGNNLGNNHYSYALMFHNECFESISVNGHASPAIGCQHGAHPYIYDNLVYQASWVGIGAKRGWPQGRCEEVEPGEWTRLVIDRPTRPYVLANRIFDSGLNQGGDNGAGIGADSTGGYDPYSDRIIAHHIEGNYVDGAYQSAIGCRYAVYTDDYSVNACDPDDDVDEPQDVIALLDLGHVEIIDNAAMGGGNNTQGIMGAGIGVNGVPHVVEISGNEVANNAWAGIGVRDTEGLSSGAYVALISDNTIYSNGMAGIGCDGAEIVTVSGNESYNNSEAGIGMKNGALVGTIAGNTFHNNGMAGIGCDDADVTTISGNECYNNVMAGIGMMNGTVVGSIDDNILHNNGTAGIGHDGSSVVVTVTEEINNIIYENGAAGIGMVNADVSSIAGNQISNNAAPGITVTAGSSAPSIDNNVLTDNGVIGATTGMSVIGGSSATITNTTITGSGMTNISILDSGSVVVLSGCTISDSGMPNVEIGPGATATATGCDISDSGFGPNIHVDGLAVIYGNTVSNSSEPGIIVAGTTGVASIDQNIVTGSGTAGVVFATGALITSFSGNQVSYSATAGVTISGEAIVNSFSDNTISHSGTSGLNVVDPGVDLTVTNTVIDHSGTAGLAAENVNANLTFVNSNIDYSGTAGITMSGGNLILDGSSVSYSGTTGIINDGDSTLIGATVDGNFYIGLNAGSNANVTITDSSISDNGTIGFYTTGSDVTVSGSTFYNNGTIGLSLTGCTIDIINCVIEETVHWGLTLQDSNGSITSCYFARNGRGGGGHATIKEGIDSITGNIFEDSSGMLGLIIGGAGSNPIISGNTFIDNWTNLEINSGASATVEGNTITSAGFGVMIKGGETDVINNIFSNSAFPVLTKVEDCDVTISGNDFTDNPRGLLLQKGTVEVYDNLFARAEPIITSGVNTYAIIRNNSFTSALRPVRADQGSHCLIHNNLVTGGLWYFKIHNGSTGELYNNTIIGTETSWRKTVTPIIASDYSTLIAKNNIITSVKAGIYDTDDTTIEDISHNDVWDSYDPPYINITDPGPGDLTVNPELDTDYTLLPTSPCINAGVDVGLPYNGSAPDMGAFEAN